VPPKQPSKAMMLVFVLVAVVLLGGIVYMMTK
jgi:hypothetical protein